MRFFTAVFGENYRQAGLGLVRSLKTYAPGCPLTVFTDLHGVFERSEIRDFSALVARYPSFYDKQGGRRNVFKYALLREMQSMYPEETITWIDADTLVFDDLTNHLVDGKVNVLAHGRRSDQVMNCGNGLQVPGDRYAISGMFSVPPGPALRYLEEITAERPLWEDQGSPNHKIGDQLILNHLVARGPAQVRWVTDNRAFIYNLEIGDSTHPEVGDEKLARMRWRGRRPVLDGRELIVWYWIKWHLDRHLKGNFKTFRPHVARRLRRLYAVA